MPMVMINETSDGRLQLYVPKKDLEEDISSLEFCSDDKWGGTIELGDGTRYAIEVLSAKPALPISLRARRAD